MDQFDEKIKNENPLVEQGEGMFVRKEAKDMSPWEKKYEDIMPRYTGTLCQ